MRPVTVKKAQLIETLKKNRDAHHAIFVEAVDGYRKEAIAQLEDHIERIKKGKVMRINVYLPEPEDHTKDYDGAIGMLEMSVDEQVELDEAGYKQFVMDDWAWKRQFLTTNSTYSLTAAALAESDDE